MDFSKMIGLGVAGNFAGHLEEAGEAKNFTDKKTDIPKAEINPIFLSYISLPTRYAK